MEALMPVKQVNHLRVLMAQKDVTYREVSEAAKVSTSTLRKIVKNETVQTDVLKKLCDYFNCHLSDLLEIVPEGE